MKPSYAILFFVIGTALMVLFYHNELLLLGLNIIATSICLAIDRWKDLKRFLLAMLVGGTCENIAVYMGAWNYADAHYLPAPLWLPIGWGLSVILLEQAFTQNIRVPRFSKKALFAAFGGTIAVGLLYQNELLVTGLFAAVTVIFYLIGMYKKEDIYPGVMAAIFGTAMETICIQAGAWHYTVAVFGTPLWLPLCWFNAFLLMRSIISFPDKLERKN